VTAKWCPVALGELHAGQVDADHPMIAGEVARHRDASGLHTVGAAGQAWSVEALMSDVDDFVAEIHPRLVAELRALHNGDPQPRLAMWSTKDPVTLFGAAMSGSGWPQVRRIFRSIASRWSDSTDQRVEILAAGVSGDLAYTVELEHTSVSVDGVPVDPYTLRVTQVYRREGGEWKVIHRHGDRLQIEQRQGLPGEASTP